MHDPNSRLDIVNHPIQSTLRLPSNCVTIIFLNFEHINDTVQSICDSLENNNGEGNQYLLILDLPDHAFNQLRYEDRPIPIGAYRIELNSNMAIIKVSCGYIQEVPPSSLLRTH